ncbi:hypothetical protein L1887_11331 [Cichorium endivia]|nr:hypothetical protein L1887_11331 [Cichorium endivia]
MVFSLSSMAIDDKQCVQCFFALLTSFCQCRAACAEIVEHLKVLANSVSRLSKSSCSITEADVFGLEAALLRSESSSATPLISDSWWW